MIFLVMSFSLLIIFYQLIVKYAAFSTSKSTISKTWMASFQTSTEVSVDELIEFGGKFPSMKEFTGCHWEYRRKATVSMSSIWSYCTVNNETDTEMRCTQFAYKPLSKTANRDILVFNVISGRVVASIEVSPFQS